MTKICLVVPAALALLAWVAPARANGYGEAKGLIEQAEAKVTAGDDAGGLALLTEAVKIQTSLDAKPKEYGYAAYVHLRLAKYYWAKNQKKKAQQEAKRALSIHLAQEEVEAAYVVSPYDPFIVQNFPALSGVKPVKLKNRTVPSAVAILKRGADAYVLGFSSLARLNRENHTSITVYRQPGKPFYRFDASSDGNRLLVVYEEDENIQYLTLNPYKLVRLKRRGLPDDVFFEPRGEGAVVVDGDVQKGYGVWRLPFAEGTAPTELGRIGGRRLASSSRRIVYSRYVGGTQGYVSGIGYNYPADKIVSRDLASGQERPLYQYAAPNSDSFVVANVVDDESLVLFIHDASAGKELLVLDGPKAREPLQREVDFGPKALDFQRMAVTADLQTVAVVSSQTAGESITVYDVGPQKTKTLGLPKSCTGAPAGEARAVMGFGLRADGGAWAHFGADFFAVDAGGAATCTDLKQFAKELKPEWAGADFAFTAPDEIYFGIEKGGGRYFIWVGFDELTAKH